MHRARSSDRVSLSSPSVRLKICVQGAIGGPATRIAAVQLTKRAASPRATVGVLNAGQRASMNLPVGHMTRAPDRSRTAAHTSKGSKGPAGVMTVLPAYCTTAETTAAELGGTIAQRVTG